MTRIHTPKLDNLIVPGSSSRKNLSNSMQLRMPRAGNPVPNCVRRNAVPGGAVFHDLPTMTELFSTRLLGHFAEGFR